MVLSAKTPAVPDSVNVYFDLMDAVNEMPIGKAKATIIGPAQEVMVDSMANRVAPPTEYDKNPFGYATYYTEKPIPIVPSYRVVITAAGYEPMEVEINYSQKKWRWGIIKMTRAARQLNEVTVTATKIKMVMRGDTLVYDATAFQLPQGSMLDDLIRNLPGATLDREGRIMVNGEMVSSLLVNGREFFKGDPWVALRNLPYYTVKDLKVYRQTPERFAMSKKKRSDEERQKDPLVMDVNLKPEYIGGWLANAEAGGGATTADSPDFRWLGRLFAMHYNKLNTFAVYAQANNLNDGQRAGTRGSWEQLRMSTGQETHKRAGIQYNHSWEDQKQNGINFNADIHRSTRESGVSSVSEEFLVGGNNFRKTAALSGRHEWELFSSFDISRRFAPGRFNFSATYNFNNGKDQSDNRVQQSRSESDLLFADPDSPEWDISSIYKRYTSTTRRNNRHGATANLELNPNIESIGWIDDLTADIGGRFNKSESPMMQTDRLDYSTLTADSYNRQRRDDSDLHGYSFSVNMRIATCKFRCGASEWSFSLGYAYGQGYNYRCFERFVRDILADYDGSETLLPSAREENPWIFDLDNSFITKTHSRDNRLSPAIDYRHRGLYARLFANIRFVHDRITDNRRNQRHAARRNGETYAPGFEIGARTDNARRGIYLQITSDQQLPDIYQSLDITETSDPLYVYSTNPRLKKSTVFRSSLEAYNSRFNLSLHFSKTYNAIASARTYNRETGVYTSRRENINGNYTAGLQFNYHQGFGPVYITNRLRPQWRHTVDYSSDGPESYKMEVNNQSVAENLEVKFNLREWSVIGKADIDWNRMETPGGAFRTMNYWDINYGVSMITPSLRGLTAETDLTVYCRRGYADPTMNRTDWVWNLRLSLPFGPSKQWIIKAEALDLLRQFPDTRRFIDATGRTEVRYNAIPAYALLTLTYRLDLKPKKK